MNRWTDRYSCVQMDGLMSGLANKWLGFQPWMQERISGWMFCVGGQMDGWTAVSMDR